MHFDFLKIRNKDALAFKLLIALSVLWLLYVPAIHELPYFVMPPHCAVISEHTDAGARYSDFFKIRGVKIIAEAFGLRADKLAEDSGTETLIRLTTGETTLIGFSDVAGPDSEPALFGASCCGWRGPVLKLMLATRWIPGLGRLHMTDSGIKYLLIDEDEPDGLKAAFAIHDNTLLATLSYNPEVIRELEYRAVHRLPLARAYSSATPWDNRAEYLHRFWISGAHTDDLAEKYRTQIANVTDGDIPAFTAARIDIGELADDMFSLTASLETPGPVFPEDSRLAPLKGKTLASEFLPLDKAAAMLVLPEAEAARITRSFIPEATFTKKPTGCDSVLTLFEGDFGPDLKVQGIQIPAVTAYISGADIPNNAFDKYGSPMGIVRNARDTKGVKYFSKSATVDIAYKQLKKAVGHMSFLFDKEAMKNEVVAISQSFDYGTLLCSSMPSMNKQFSTPYAGLSNDWGKWLDEHNPNGNAVAFLSVDMGKTLALAGKITAVLQLVNSFVRIDGVDRNTLSLVSAILTEADFKDHLNAVLFKEAENKVSLELTSVDHNAGSAK